MPNPVIVRRLLASGSGGSGLDTVWAGLTAYWKLEEATGASRLDSTGNNNTLTDTSANVAQGVGIIGKCGSLAGSGSQALEIADNNFVGVSGSGHSFSCSLWIKSAGTANAGIVGKWASVDNVFGRGVMDWLIGLNGGNNLCVNLQGPGFFDTGIIYGGGGLTNAWQHLAITFSSINHTLLRYMNGSLVGTTVEIADVQRGSGPFAIFNYGSVHAASVVGSIDEVGLWSRALSSTEVAHLYNSGSGLVYPLG